MEKNALEPLPRYRLLPAGPAARRANLLLALRRAGFAALGASLAALPIFAVRALFLMAIAGGFDKSLSFISYIPLEFGVAFLFALFLQRIRPTLHSLPFSAAIVGATTVGAPLLLGATIGYELFRHFSALGQAEQVWITMLAAMPSFGALGLFGLLFLCFPLLLASFIVTLGLDVVFRRSHRAELAAADKARQHARSARAGFYDVPGLSPAEQEQLSREFAALDQAFYEALPQGVASPAGDILVRLHDQLHEALIGLAGVMRALHKKLNPTEITYQRYAGSARRVYQALLQRLRQAGQHPHEPEALRQLVQGNDEGLRVLRDTAAALAALRLESGQAAYELDASVRDLEELARRVDRYQPRT